MATSAERMRVLRERVRRGLRRLTIDVREDDLRVIAEHGYEGASLTGLTKAMGISTTSMYTAFGNKEELFGKALERYTEGPSAYLTRALEKPTALGVATAILTGVVRTTTRPAQRSIAITTRRCKPKRPSSRAHA